MGSAFGGHWKSKISNGIVRRVGQSRLCASQSNCCGLGVAGDYYGVPVGIFMGVCSGEGKCSGSLGAAAATLLLLRTSAMLVRRLFSKLHVMCMPCQSPHSQSGFVHALPNALWKGIPACAMLAFTQSLKRFSDLPLSLLPRQSSPYRGCLGILESSIWITCMSCPSKLGF